MASLLHCITGEIFPGGSRLFLKISIFTTTEAGNLSLDEVHPFGAILKPGTSRHDTILLPNFHFNIRTIFV